MKTASTNFLTMLLTVFLFGTACNEIQEDTSGQKQVWKMQDGLAVIEVEATNQGGTAEGKWEMVPDSLAGFTGDAAYVFTTSGNMYKDPLVVDGPETDGDYKLSYEVWVEEPGEYELKIRNYHHLKDGDNDAWISINKRLYQKIWDHDPGQWNWTEAIANIKSYQPFELRKGVNTIDIVGRSKGFAIDRITIFKKGTPEEVWSDTTNEQSPLMLPEQPDNTAPSTPQNLEVMHKSTASVKLKWDESSDDFEVYGYKVLVDSQVVGETYLNHYNVSGLEPDKDYAITVKAMDFSGNNSEPSEAINVKTEPFSDEDGLVIASINEDITIDGEAEAAWGNISEHQLTISNEPTEADDFSGSFKVAWDNDNLYFLITVNDDKPLEEDGTKDGFDLYLDLDNNKSARFLYDDRTYHFSLSRPQKDGEFHVLTAKINRDAFIENVQEAHVIESNGYQYELAFPWKTLGIVPEKGTLIGMDMLLRDTDNVEIDVQNRLGWYHPEHKSAEAPMYLGTAKLGGAESGQPQM